MPDCCWRRLENIAKGGPAPQIQTMPAPSKTKAAAAKPAPASRPLKAGDHLFLVDGSGYIFRAYHALPPLTRKSDGLQINAVLGFCNMLWKLLNEMKPEERPTHLAVVFDKSEKTFRTDFYPEYKAHRPEAPDDLKPQFPLIREAVRAFDIPCLEQAGFEADDLIATYARIASEAKATTMIVSSDKDLMQLVTNGVALYDTMKDVRIDREAVIEKFGVPPEQVIDVQALMGDSTDNVPGVRGVGPKAASTLIFELGSLDRILDAEKNPEKIENELQNKLDQVESQIAGIAGRQIKFNSSTQIAEILAINFGVKDIPKDKKGVPSADTELIERLTREGSAPCKEFCKGILRARNLSRVIGGTVGKIIEKKSDAVTSKELVTLRTDVPLDVPVEDLIVHEPDYRHLVAFLKAMEFNTLTRRIAEKSGVDAAEIEADAKLSAGGATASPPPLRGRVGEGGASRSS